MRIICCLLAATATATLVGCNQSSETTILCGSSFKAPMERLVEMYKTETGETILLSFGGSEDLLPHVETKTAGDLFVTHSPFMQKTEEAGSLLREVPVGFLAPVLVVAKGNPKKITSIDDLAGEGVSVVLPNPKYSTCGEMIDKLLEKKGIRATVLNNVDGAIVRDHAKVGNHVKLGTRDAGIMWNGVAKNFADDIEIVEVPYEYDAEVGVSIMGLSYTKNKAQVEKFLDFAEKHGKEVFAEFGYVKD